MTKQRIIENYIRQIIREHLMTEAVASVETAATSCIAVTKDSVVGLDGYDKNSSQIDLLSVWNHYKGSLKSWEDAMDFCQFVPAKNYPGKQRNEVIFKLSREPSKKLSLAAALSLGARVIPDDYLLDGSPFIDALSSDVSGNEEALGRNIEIARLRTDADIIASKPYNNSESFYVLIDNFIDNKYVISRAAKSITQDAQSSLIALIMKDPLGGYGKYVKQMPPKQRDAFINACTATSAVLSIGSIPLLTGEASPLFAAANIGPSLALASIAWSEESELEAAIYFFGSLLSAYGAWKQCVSMVMGIEKLAATMGTTTGRSQSALANLVGGKISYLGQVRTLLDRVTRQMAGISGGGFQITGEAAETWVFQTARGPLTNDAGEIIYFVKEEVDFITALSRSNGGVFQSLALLQKLESLVDGVSGAFAVAFGVGGETVGLTFDAIQLSEIVVNGNSPVKPEIIRFNESPAAVVSRMLPDFEKFKENATSKFSLPQVKVGNDVFSDWSKLKQIDRTNSMTVINSMNFDVKSENKLELPATNLYEIGKKYDITPTVKPDILVLPDAEYQAFDKLVKFSGSLFKNKFFLYKDPVSNQIIAFLFN